ncbi:hypothetical protein AGR56_15590 [Clostridium sp. DMHC 10]|uniref:polymer-forming cytoskeletal protein n=1 Tax=Clostridium sp. DMHC 10 TaxID=747377 RepID=UPI00069DB094|nr:polymer-forming cytoskeletal protein [Clostridium sp. DMHC 10]KOF57692.1 hypothetical protein AGR56_15590 [Clostridium sp. DMHC 10]
MENERRNLKLSGAGIANGGFYNEVKLSGGCKINGDIDCNFMKTSGACNVKGNITSKQLLTSGSFSETGNIDTEIFKSSGSSKIDGNLKGDEVTISGSGSVYGDIKVSKLNISGGFKTDGKISGGEIKLSGGVKIEKDCECDKFFSKGSFNIGGTLNADEINITIYDYCSAEEIVGQNIDIRYSSDISSSIFHIIKDMLSSSSNSLTAQTIEGDNIYLEHTTAKIVRGNKITIGDNCNIDKIEYKDDLDLTGNSKIGSKTQI